MDNSEVRPRRQPAAHSDQTLKPESETELWDMINMQNVLTTFQTGHPISLA